MSISTTHCKSILTGLFSANLELVKNAYKINIPGQIDLGRIVEFSSGPKLRSKMRVRGKERSGNSFDLNLYERLVNMLPTVVNVMEDTILEIEPSDKVFSMNFKSE